MLLHLLLPPLLLLVPILLLFLVRGTMQKDPARWELFARGMLHYVWRFVDGPRTYYEVYYDL